jgi:hypothetical protein
LKVDDGGLPALALNGVAAARLAKLMVNVDGAWKIDVTAK